MSRMQEAGLLVFDLDGTLVRSGDDITASINHTLGTLGLPLLSSEKVREFVGDGATVLMTRALGEEAAGYLDRAMALFAAHYSEHLLDRTGLYPDVLSVLDHFGSKKKIIATNKTAGFALRIAQGLGIATHFLDILGEDSTPFKKPDPRLLQMVMEKWGEPPERTVMIGDGVNDLLLARGAGAMGCAFLNGITSRDRLLALSPEMTCETLTDLKTLIR